MGAGKLTTIVAVDVDGFSAMAEADETGAIAAVARLGERCANIASEHGGRIFNTSGDAVNFAAKLEKHCKLIVKVS